jgi:hypothetical protein
VAGGCAGIFCDHLIEPRLQLTDTDRRQPAVDSPFSNLLESALAAPVTALFAPLPPPAGDTGGQRPGNAPPAETRIDRDRRHSSRRRQRG